MSVNRRHGTILAARRLLPVFLVAFLGLVATAQARTVTDSAGRVVAIPDEVTRVFAAGPPASILVYALKPEALLGWPRALRDYEKPYIAEPYRELPETGRLTGRGGGANLERVLALKPDLIVDFGSVRDTYIDLANRVQRQTGFPYILVNGRFEETAASLRLVGEALGVPGRGEALAADVEATFAELAAALDAVPENDRPRVYLARGPDGLETGLKGSINTEIIERAGGRNVAEVPGQYGLVQASPEAVIVADPDTIMTWDRHFFSRVWVDPLWQGITAVRAGRVYLSPTAPFGWIDRPPSINRMMGLKWLAGLFYPERWSGDEPTASLDFGNQTLVLQQIAGLAADGLTVILSTHDPDHAFAVGTDAALLHEGRVRATGAPAVALTAEALSSVYGVDVRVEGLADGRTVCVPSLARGGDPQE